MLCSANRLKNGLKIIVSGRPCIIISSEMVKPGKGQAFSRVKLKDLVQNKVLEKTFKSGDKVEVADVSEIEMQYIYNDGATYYFMHAKTFEQYEVAKNVIGSACGFLIEQDYCTIILWNDSPIAVIPQQQIVLEIANTEPGLRGDTQGSVNKLATTTTGVTIQVPLFINIGDKVKVYSKNGEYIARI